MTLATYGRGRSPSSRAARSSWVSILAARSLKIVSLSLGIKDEMFGQFVQLPLTGMPLQGVVLIAQAS